MFSEKLRDAILLTLDQTNQGRVWKMSQRLSPQWFLTPLVALVVLLVASSPSHAQKKGEQACFTQAERDRAEKTAKVYQAPDPGYDPVLGYNPANGPRPGAPPVDENRLAKPVNCVAKKDQSAGSGSTPTLHLPVPGVTHENGKQVRYKVKPHFKGQTPEKRNGEVYGEFLSSRFSKAVGFFA